MDQKTFEQYMRRADQLRRVGDETQEFWRGYVTGIRRHFHGESFGTPAEHERRISIPPDNPHRGQFGNGYRAGFLGIDPSQLSGNSGLTLDDSLNFIDQEGTPIDLHAAITIIRRERGPDWLSAACCKSRRTIDGWNSGRTPGEDSLRLLRLALTSTSYSTRA